MRRTVSAADANRHFSEILGQAIIGHTVIITKRGQPVAQLAPYDRSAAKTDGGSAWNRLFQTLEDGVDLGDERFDRDALYDR
ncbi:type II toxin-antitoxin system prevent-host-death family antitoxin [Azospirillum sp. TSA2s]|jgi:prevent-host-death family protein|uniref:type II toxin-antitoxin system Phd/YefM family antitoxin n=1 Tax=Azospirillum sp. TSA2s TaxID=709810 RepID=UPI0010A9D2D2|nr:type II toxin-antitoxin system prevent-host-death family antitoxin [Azospirillum sp. TSA2s]QCG94655.1 type II toxin-antitoxin system prevent-host-death family antitoxin [Azospirillum sp. TSA2s]